MNLVNTGEIKLDKKNLVLLSVEVEGLPQYQEKVYVRTLFPITTFYSTLKTAEQRKRTYYYSPFEKEFEELLIKNLLRKLRTWHGCEINHEEHFARIKPYNVRFKHRRVIIYKNKNTVIKGWDGIFELSLHPKLFNLAFDVGLGAKNSLGFVCIKVWKENEVIG